MIKRSVCEFSIEILPVITSAHVVEDVFISQRIVPHLDVCQLTIKTWEINHRLT